jgi:hypothetical protein
VITHEKIQNRNEMKLSDIWCLSNKP